MHVLSLTSRHMMFIQIQAFFSFKKIQPAWADKGDKHKSINSLNRHFKRYSNMVNALYIVMYMVIMSVCVMLSY